MEHLDLAGYLNTPVNWNLGAFEQQGKCNNNQEISLFGLVEKRVSQKISYQRILKFKQNRKFFNRSYKEC